MISESIIRELQFNFARSSGSGGQHVNKVQTKVELRFDIPNSSALSDSEKSILLEGLKNRVSQDGILILTNQESRSQSANKEAVTKYLVELIEAALKPRKKRKKVVQLVAESETRLSKKKQLAEKKDFRKKVEAIDNDESES
jgi:ribosome-associated protein